MLHHAKSVAGRLRKDERGASLLEYSVLIGLIIAITVGAVTAVGTWSQGRWDNLKSALGITTPAAPPTTP
jgi:pilus assembly protein Flp/PilA